MPTPRPGAQATLEAAATGDRRAAAELAIHVEGELRALAARYLRRERRHHTLQPTALVNEAFVRLLRGAPIGDASRTHFLAVAATTMRRVLVDHARRRAAARRGGGAERMSVDTAVAAEEPPTDLLVLDDALRRLAALHERQARIVELRFFGGVNDDAIASLLGVSRRTVQGDWSMARAWLRRELGNAEEA